jgi:hypothetical protein
MEIVLNRRIASGDPRRFEFVETVPLQPEIESGFTEFIKDSSLSGSAGRNRTSKKAEIQWKAAYSTLLLSRIAEPERPAPFSRRKIDRRRKSETKHRMAERTNQRSI